MFTLAFFEKNLVFHDMIEKSKRIALTLLYYILWDAKTYINYQEHVYAYLSYTMSTSIGKLDSIILHVVTKKKERKIP